jgi:hypothetical protein
MAIKNSTSKKELTKIYRHIDLDGTGIIKNKSKI